MRVEGVVLIMLLALGAAPAAAADPAGRSHRPGAAERVVVSSRAAERYYGPQLPLRGATEQVVVERGPRILLEDDFYGLFEPVFATRRLPQRVRVLPVEAEVPLYEVVETRGARNGRRQGR